MSDLNELVERYLGLWNEADADTRQRAIAAIWAENGTYTDPLAAVEGPQAIDAVIAAVRHQFPGFVFRLLGGVDTHHNIARFSWELVPGEGGESIVVGFDVAVVTDDGRIGAVYGFLDKVPSA